MFKTIKKYLFTWYDPNTDKINAEPNTLAYYHEEGHQKQYKLGLITTFQMYSWYLMMGAIWFLAFNKKLFAQIFIIVSFSLILFLELDAWIYALRTYKK